MLAGRDVEYVPYVGQKDVVGVLRCMRHAHGLFRRRRPTRAVSTGSGIALGYLPYLAARGVECHYIESATRVSGPSVTGRVLQWVPGVRTYTQYQSWADSRWQYGGSVFDGYESAAMAREPDAMVRVVVTVGAATQYPFRRLIDHLVPLLAPEGALAQTTGLPVEVLWQTADTPVDDLPIHATPALPAAELGAALAKADDSKLSDTVDLYGGHQGPRAFVFFALTNDWADHYSTAAMYLRLNGLLPPTAKK